MNQLSKKDLINFVKATLFLACLFLIAKYLSTNWSQVKNSLTSLSIQTMSIVSVSYLLYLLISILLTRQSQSNVFKFNLIDSTKIACLNSISSVAGFLIPSGATPTKLLLLNQFFNLSKISSLNMIVRLTSSFLLTSSIIAFLTCILIYLLMQNSNIDLQLIKTIGFASLICILIVMIILSGKVFRRINIKLSSIKFDSIMQVRNLVILSSIQIFIFAFILLQYLNDVEINASGVICLFLISVSNLTMILPLTPGNLGIREGLYYYLAPQVGIDPHVLVTISLVDRVVQLLFFSTTSIVSYCLIKK